MAGHLFKLFSFWLIFRAIVSTTLKDPYNKLIERERRFRDFAESASDWFWEQDEDFRFVDVQAQSNLSSSERSQDVIGNTRWDFLDGSSEVEKHWKDHIEDYRAHRSFRDFRYSNLDSRGDEHFFSVSGKPFFDEDGAFRGYRGTSRALTELVDAQRNNERFLLALEQISDGLSLWDAEGRFVLCNNYVREMAGNAAIDLVPGISHETWLQALMRHGMAPDAVGREQAWLSERLAFFQNPVGTLELQVKGRWQQFRYQKLRDGSTINVLIDIHDQKLNEEQLRRSQRLKAVGQLTGGVAHDFNNLLAALAGYAVLLEQRIPDDKTTQRYLEAINQVVARGAFLTNRLLSFSRQQALSPATTAVNGLVLGLEDMLRRSLGEAIELKIDLASGSCLASIDSHQFEDALLNLTINARDAMPNGGTLRIETANVSLDEAYAERQEEVTPGDYVLVTVSDSGTGMPPEIIEKAYEPFFTTKDVGEGSGLGLSMVYGFAKQSNGHLSIDSEVGQGTTIKLYVPCSLEVVAHRY